MYRAAAMLLAGYVMASPAMAAAVLQCVPYARAVSGVELYGDALTWWDQAQNRYRRGDRPHKGAVLAFRPNGSMALGHVAVVSKVLDDRRVLIRHANWSVPGAIEEDVLAIDVSEDGDWSAVRVWYSPGGQMGARVNPTYGFIYPAREKLRPFTPDDNIAPPVRFAGMDMGTDEMGAGDGRDTPRQASAPVRPARVARIAATSPRKVDRSGQRASTADPFIVEYADARSGERSLDDIIADIKRGAALR